MSFFANHSEEFPHASRGPSPAPSTTASPATSEDNRLVPLFGHINYNYDGWRNFEVPDTISDELREKVRIDVRKQWYAQRLYPQARRMTQAIWLNYEHCGHVLNSELGEIKTREKALLFCNKPSGFYWSEDQLQASMPDGRGSSLNTLFASVFSEWHRAYDDQPNIDFDHFVANPFSITGAGPVTIRGIIKAHLCLYANAKELLSGDIQCAGTESRLEAFDDTNTDHFLIHPLYPTLVLICDRDEISPSYKDYERPDRYVRLRDLVHLQSLIIARTGFGEDKLSRPISFESLKSKILPLDRDDFDGRANVDVLRVRLTDAIRFIVELEKREDEFTLQETGSKRNPWPYRVSHPESASGGCYELGKLLGHQYAGSLDEQQQFADQHIAAGEQHGYKFCTHLIEAIRRVSAEMNDESYGTLAPSWFRTKLVDYEGELGPQY